MSHLDRATAAATAWPRQAAGSPRRVSAGSPGRRDRVAGPQVRAGLRQPAVGRPRHRRRPPDHRERGRAPRAVLGAARWRRQLRGGHVARPSGCTSSPSSRPALLMWRAERGRAGAARVPRPRSRAGRTRSGAAPSTLTAPPEEFVPEHLVGELRAAGAGDVHRHRGRAARRSPPRCSTSGAGRSRWSRRCRTPTCSACSTTRPASGTTGPPSTWASLPDEAVDGLRRLTGDAAAADRRRQHVCSRQVARPAASTADYPMPWRSRARGWRTRSRCGPTSPTTSAAAPGRGDVRAAVQPWATGDVYLNFIGDEGRDRVRAGFGRVPGSGCSR